MVSDDPAEALELVRRGRNVVLIVNEETVATPVEEGKGRLAIFVGDPSDPATHATAHEMDEELFSSRR